jgi:nucleotide-binding universal stress UspA family protein
MHTHILLPTDGSELSEQAVNYGVALAKALNAKVTGLTVSTPFQFIALEPHLATDTLESYALRMSTVAAQRLHWVKNAASAAGLKCDVVHA